MTIEIMQLKAETDCYNDSYKTEEHAEIVPVATAELPTHLADHVSYGGNGMRALLSSPYVFGAAFLASLGGFSFGYDQGVMSIINVMPQFHAQFPQSESAFGKSFMTGMLQLGSFFGVLAFPWLADKISRKRALTAVVIIFDIGAIIQTTSQSYATLVVGRAIGGIGVGTLAMVSICPIQTLPECNFTYSLYIRERLFISPRSHRLICAALYWCSSPYLLYPVWSLLFGLHSLQDTWPARPHSGFLWAYRWCVLRFLVLEFTSSLTRLDG